MSNKLITLESLTLTFVWVLGRRCHTPGCKLQREPFGSTGRYPTVIKMRAINSVQTWLHNFAAIYFIMRKSSTFHLYNEVNNC